MQNKINKLRNIIRKIIQESFESDISTLEFAEDIYGEIFEKVSSTSKSDWNISEGVGTYYFEENNYSPSYLRVEIQANRDKPELSGKFLSRGGKRNIIRINIGNTLEFIEEDMINEFVSHLFHKRDTIVHELVHYFDKERGDYKSKPIGTSYILKMQGYKSYLNTPKEYNSHYMAFIDHIRNTLKNKYKTGEYDHIKKLLESFSRFKRTFVRLSYGDWIDNLNEKYRKKFLKRLYKFYTGIKEKYKEKTI